MKELVLASSSKRRRDLLKNMGYSFRSVAPETDEEDVKRLNLPPFDMVKKLSETKALAALNICGLNAVILAADTVVVTDGLILGKPADKEEAYNMLKALSGKKHTVCTAVTILDTETGRRECFAEKADVFMASLAEDEIWEYIKTGQPMDKAGAYGIQGIGGLFVSRIEGGFYTVMGLPADKVYQALKRFGIYPMFTDRDYI